MLVDGGGAANQGQHGSAEEVLLLLDEVQLLLEHPADGGIGLIKISLHIIKVIKPMPTHRALDLISRPTRSPLPLPPQCQRSGYWAHWSGALSVLYLPRLHQRPTRICCSRTYSKE